MMWIIILFIYSMGVFGAYVQLAQFVLEDLDGYKRLIPYVFLLLWPLAVAWMLILIVYDATIGNYLWKRQHRKWLNEKDL